MSMPKTDDRERFLRRVIIVTDGHWHMSGEGRKYRPSFEVNGQQMWAARAAYLLFRGPLNGLDASHLCGDNTCVNPWHLIGEPNSANQARKRLSHCQNGHELTAENRRSGGFTKAGTQRWKCRLCDNEREARRDRERRAAMKRNLTA